MRRLLLAGAALFGFVAQANAVPLVSPQGVTYELESLAPVGLTKTFALKITNENVVGVDTEGGRTGINAFAFNEPVNGATSTGHIIATSGFSPSAFSFVEGGINSSGCQINPSTNFFCFDNGGIPPTPTTPLAGPLVIVFDVTLNAGFTWTGYAPDFKIDWVGTANNYDLVSLPIDVGTVCPDCTINPTGTPVPEPMSIALLGVGLLGIAGMTHRRRFMG